MADGCEFYNEIIGLFHRFDANRDGSISYDELRELLQIIGVQPQDIARVFDTVDSNKDGKVDWEEFLAWIHSESSPVQEKLVGSGAVATYALQKIHSVLAAQNCPLEDLFRSEAQPSNPHYLLKADVFRMMLRYDAALTQSTLEHAYTAFDYDGNGGVDLNEFLHAFATRTANTPSAAPVPVAGAAAETVAAESMRVLEYVGQRLRQHGVALEVFFMNACQRTPGYLHKEELFAMLLESDGQLSMEVLDHAFRVFDWDGSGFIELKEFLQAFPGHVAAQTQAAARQEVQVTVPAGCPAGTQFPIDHLNQRYYATVPAGYLPGHTLRVTI